MKFRTDRYEQLVDDLDSLADWMSSLKGLKSKTWLQDAESKQIGGIYHFETQDDLYAYKNCSELLDFKKQYEITDYQESCFQSVEVDEASRKNNSPFFTNL
jgi:hypothetical protein